MTRQHLAILRKGVKAWNEWRRVNLDVRPDLRSAGLRGADLTGADLAGTDLVGTDLRGANLTRANLTQANLDGADLREASLDGAYLARAYLSEASLTQANLREALLERTILDGARLQGADLSRAGLFATVLTNVDLSQVRGLDTVRHGGPSTIGIDTLLRSGGKIPEAFLRGCGVPDFQTLMLPLLQLAADGQEHRLSEAIEALAHEFRLSDADRRELLPSGKQSKFVNRIGWAVTYLRKTRLLEGTGKGRFRITERGLEELRTPPPRIDLRYLEKFPELAAFRGEPTQNGAASDVELAKETSQTPREVLEASYQVLRRELAQELLERIKQRPPAFFEKLVVDLLVAMGYGGSRKDAGERVGRSGDGGIDGVIKEDKLGLDYIYIQAKRWEGTVGRPQVQTFAGALDEQKARKGVMITTSTFSQDAERYVGRIEKKIALIDGETLAQLMIEHNVGVAEEATYTVKKADLDYFEEE